MVNQNNEVGVNRPARNTNWWGRGSDLDQGCFGCGPAWWIVAMVVFLLFLFWGWGYPGWGGWGGWGWRYNPGTNTAPANPGYGTPNR